MIISSGPKYSFDVQSKILSIGKCIDENSKCTINQADYQNSGPFKTYKVVKIDPGATEIGPNAFLSSTALEEIFISNWINTIHVPFCRYCKNLKFISLTAESQYFENDDLGNLYEKGKKVIVRAPPKIANNKIADTTEVILDQAFHETHGDTLLIPKNVIEIKAGSFYDSGINTLVFSADSIISSLNFSSISTSNIKVIKFPASIKHIKDYSVSNNKQLNSISFPDNSELISIEEGSFNGDINLKAIKLPHGLQTIAGISFGSCIALQTVELSASLTFINETAFSGCKSISSITIPESNNYYKTLNGSLYNKNMDSVIIVSSSLSEFEINNSLLYIGQTALQVCPLLKKLVISDTHPRFMKNEKMLIEKETMTVLAFVGGIESVEFPDGVISLGPFCAYNCQFLTIVNTPISVTTIQEYCFALSSITSINIPGVTSIGAYAFKECKSLVNLSFLDKGQLKLGKFCFQDCAKISHLHFKCSVSNVPYCCFQRCGARKVMFDKDGFSSLGESSFEDTSNLEYVDLPYSLKTINSAFVWSSIKTLRFSNGCGVTSIMENAFLECKQLENITIGDSLETLKTNSFGLCTSLRSVIITDACPITDLTAEAFTGCVLLTTFNVPSNVKSIDPSIFTGCTGLMSVTANRSTNFKSVNGILYNIQNNTNILTICPPGIDNAEIAENINGLGVRCFYECTKLGTIDFKPSSKLSAIGDSVFYGCSSLMRLNVPLEVENISGTAFSKCSKLSEVVFDRSSALLSLGDGVFSDCPNLRSINLEACANLRSIPAECFKSCALLEQIKIPVLVEDILESTFEGCAGLKSVSFSSPSSLRTIGAAAFRGCKGLRTIKFPGSLEQIRERGFAGSGLGGTLILPKGIKRVSSAAFSGCPVRHIVHCGLSKLEDDALDGATATVHVVPWYPSNNCLGAAPERDAAPECYIATLENVRSCSILYSILQENIFGGDE